MATMVVIQDEPTNPVVLIDLPELTLPRTTTRRRSKTSLMGHVPELSPGTDLIAPSGLRGYVAGKAFDGSGRIVFVIVEGHGRDATHTTVETWPEAFSGWRTAAGDVL